jgi:ubiquinone/menaquinone biosynthesis C-methylase UbiE
MKDSAEFNGIRAKMYADCIDQFSTSREEDIEVMFEYLTPRRNETILEVGAGNGFFSKHLSKVVKKLIVSDPSKDQLKGIKKLDCDNVSVVCEGADVLTMKKNMVDAVWSFGALHHCFNKVDAFKNFNRILKKNGRVVIGDVWSDSNLAKHFDDHIAKYCVTGHEVAFWSDEFAESVCFLSGFAKPVIKDLNLRWKFKKKSDIGKFIYLIHGMTGTTEENCLRSVEKILGIEKKGDYYCLNWPMKILIAKKK